MATLGLRSAPPQRVPPRPVFRPMPVPPQSKQAVGRPGGPPQSTSTLGLRSQPPAPRSIPIGQAPGGQGGGLPLRGPVPTQTKQSAPPQRVPPRPVVRPMPVPKTKTAVGRPGGPPQRTNPVGLKSPAPQPVRGGGLRQPSLGARKPAGTMPAARPLPYQKRQGTMAAAVKPAGRSRAR